MYMAGENLDSLVNLMNSVIDEKSVVKMRITNTQYSSMYLNIFLDEVARNGGDPLHYDTFGNRLWIKLNMDVNSFTKDADEFMNVWNGWVDLYRYLKSLDRI